ncbi:MAG: methyltransferase, CheR-type [Fibrobacteres bacterium]|nr:methyltransferase, CheR-type [Fibrobacterota bacterium]
MNLMEMDRDAFDQFRTLVYAKSGITLGDGKEALVSARVGKRMRQLGMGDFQSYLDWVKGAGGEDEMVQLLDAISTNVTSFYREPVHFEVVDGAIRRWWEQGQRRFRIWCAASSTGEEPYTLAMTLRECLGGEGDVRLLATDISTRVLKAAKAGEYAESKLESLPPGFAGRFFTRGRKGDGIFHTAKDELKSMILYKRINLAFPPFPMQGPMDIIMCRNVMIYFDNAVRQRLISEFRRLLKPGGYLIVGHAESLTGLAEGFKSVRPAVYVKEA